ncbi:MAG: ABC transporter permease [Anaerolineae bacterium]
MRARVNTSTTWQMVVMAMQYMRVRRLRTALTTLAIVLGVTLVFAVNLALPSAMAALSRTTMSAAGRADLTVTSPAGVFAAEAPLTAIREVPGVNAATAVLRRQIGLPNDGGGLGAPGQVTTYQLVGIDAATVLDVHPYVVTDGRMLEASESGVAMLPSWLAASTPQLQVGSTFPLATAGGLRAFTVVGLYADQGSQDTPQVLMGLSDAQSVLAIDGQVSAIEVALAPGSDHATVANAVEEALGPSFSVDSGATEMDAYVSMQVGYVIFNLFGLLALFMGAFLIFNTFRTVVAERRRDLAMLRAIGATRGQVMQVILTEGLVQGVVGTALGLILGYALAASLMGALTSLYAQFRSGMELAITLNLTALLVSICLGLLTSLAASYLPARAAGRVSPLEALRPVDAGATRRATRLSLYVSAPVLFLGVVMLVAGTKTAPLGAIMFLIGMVAAAPVLVSPVAHIFGPLLTLWFSREGDLARGNLTRQPGRAAVTAGTLMVGLATLILLASLVSSFGGLISGLANRSFASDAMLVPASVGVYGSVIGADPSLAERLRALPPVAAATGLRAVTTTADGQEVQVLGIDPLEYPKVAGLEFAEGDGEAAVSALAAGRNAIVTSLAANSLGLGTGDDVVMQTAEGPRTYRIVAVGDDMLSFKVMGVFISHESIVADFHKTEDVMLMVNYVPGTDRAAALEQIRQVAAAYPQFTVRDTGEYRATVMEMSVGVLQAFYGLAALILIPAALGLLNTLTINVIERTREIGMVRAIGGSRAQVRRMVTGEALLLGLFGAATGILAGVAMSYGFIQAFGLLGWTLPYEPPLVAVVVALVVAVVLALLAAILPARNAARLDIIRALQYE